MRTFNEHLEDNAIQNKIELLADLIILNEVDINSIMPVNEEILTGLAGGLAGAAALQYGKPLAKWGLGKARQGWEIAQDVYKNYQDRQKKENIERQKRETIRYLIKLKKLFSNNERYNKWIDNAIYKISIMGTGQQPESSMKKNEKPEQPQEQPRSQEKPKLSELPQTEPEMTQKHPVYGGSFTV